MTVNHELAKMIDHTLLKPDATLHDIEKLCAEAKEYGFCSVCVNPTWVRYAATLLAGSGVKVCTVVGFPLGATTTATKVAEAQEAVANGATEIDMVINVGLLKSGHLDDVRHEIATIEHMVRRKALLKVIIETALLTDNEKVAAALAVQGAGADYVKTSTGFAASGATVADVELLAKTVGPHVGVKASGGVRDVAAARAMIGAGATRIGSSNSVAIVTAG